MKFITFWGDFMLFLLFKNISSFIRRHPLVFFLFCAGQIVSILSVLLIYGVVASPQKEDESYNLEIRTFEVTPSTEFHSNFVSAINALLKSSSKELRTVTLAFEGKTPLHAEALYPSRNRFYVSRGDYLTKADFEQGRKKAVVSSQLHKGVAVGQRIPLAGGMYEVVGIFDSALYDEIPFSSLENYTGASLLVTTQGVPTKSEADAFQKDLEGRFTGASVTLPKERNLETTARNLVQVVVSTAIGLLAIVNISYLYRYLLAQRKSTYAVWRICGCTAKKGAFLYAAESFLLSTGLFAVCVLIYAGLLQRLFARSIYTYYLQFADYLLLYGLYAACILLIFGVVIRSYSRQKPRALFQGGNV